MKITWDSEVRAIYLYVDESTSAPHDHTQEITDLINIDWDKAGNVSGVEILGLDSIPIIRDITHGEGDRAIMYIELGGYKRGNVTTYTNGTYTITLDREDDNTD